VKYQGTAALPGNFTDFHGMFFGAGGFESGDYNQHHGWVLWALCRHYLLSRDEPWWAATRLSAASGADWINRQRRTTTTTAPSSRGWEYGLMPAGSLEDVTDFYYWLSVNAVMVRALSTFADTLHAASDHEADHYRREAEAYRRDFLRSIKTARERSPLVRLRDGRWVPHDPSRLYRRGRDVGWIRETLEGSMFLLTCQILDPHDPQAKTILEDYHDNRFTRPPFGYHIDDFERNWFSRGGFSMQPNLLGTPMVHLDRDEPELFLWSFFNSFAATYREEINAMVEHPMPVLGYSNAAHFKTSDEANATGWIRSMMVYEGRDVLHFGRATPRRWLKQSFQCERAATRFGHVGVRYEPTAIGARAVVDLNLHEPPKQCLVRFRVPQKGKGFRATIDGQAAPVTGEDVAIPAVSGRVVVEAVFA
jgi:hypothetical protein